MLPGIVRSREEWRPLKVGYERYGLQSDVQHIEQEQHRTNTDFRIVELGGSMSKVDRIRRLIPLFEQGKFLLPHTRWRTLLDKTSVNLVDILVETELLQFPVAAHDDMLDAMSRVLDEDLKVKQPLADAAREARRRDRPQFANVGFAHLKPWIKRSAGGGGGRFGR